MTQHTPEPWNFLVTEYGLSEHDAEEAHRRTGAPELLEAARLAILCFNDFENGETPDAEDREAIEAAIAKATGQEVT